MERVELLLTALDARYEAFAASLPEPLAAEARALAVTLGLAPTPDIPWSEVFANEVTLGAALLVAEAMPEVDAQIALDAGFAHMLAVIEAFGTDRIFDGQVARTPGLVAVLVRAAEAREAAVARVHEGESFEVAERETLAAIYEERDLFAAAEGATFERYLAVSHGKQRVGLPASLALARAAGWDARRLRSLARTLDAIWLGLQLHDDVIDWEDDLTRGGAWAATLSVASAADSPSHERNTVPVSMQRMVLASGVLPRMLRTSARLFRAARRRAEILGAHRLAAWARQREVSTAELAAREAETPGYTGRSRALSMWAKVVLA